MLTIRHFLILAYIFNLRSGFLLLANSKNRREKLFVYTIPIIGGFP